MGLVMPDSDRGTAIAELIGLLSLEAGRIMEDESLTCALALPENPAELATRLQQIATSGNDIATLAAGAQVLHRRSMPPRAE